ncbi:cardiolipin synthase [Desulfosarcina ovata]|uniref:Cardiolipin synthase n=1 Tax=Desulfosarcina ovata subsp. ovata TaxID=2752305 RepID=A0A5K8AC66_9BACT|nr:cardiolipin synthase [Desulfosarcina ovata]BBO90106.1 cardiolipin synthase A [Desulfosarcina ovata subsp. ovata]
MPAVQLVIEYWMLLIPLCLHIFGILFIFDAVMNGRTSQGTIAWVMALFFFPYLAVFLYLIFGARRIQDYSTAHQSGTTDIHHLGKMLLRDRRLRELMERGTPQIDVLSDIYQFPVMKGNRATLLIDGEETFNSILNGIALAQHYVLVQFFIVHADDLGNRFKAALIERARAGVKVYFLYDRMGSFGLRRSYIRDLRAAGVHVAIFRVGSGWLNRFHINFRNHRKIVVVDGEKSWVGGHNVGDAYLGKGRRFAHWRDTHVKVEGPVTLAVQLSFVEDWHWARGQLPDISWAPPPEFGHEPVLCIPTGPGDLVESCSLMMVQAINAANRRCWILSPYFVPDVAVIKALQLAAMRGVDVRILIPAIPDKRVVWWAAHSYLAEVAVAGVRMYTYQDGFMHQKVFLIDDSMAGVGTANLDNRSLRINFEITMVFTDTDFIHRVERMCRTDFSASTPLTTDDVYRRSLAFRLAIRAARLFSPIL